MTTPDAPEVYQAAPALDELRNRILSEAPSPAVDPADFARVGAEARRVVREDRITPRPSEIRVRIAGTGVSGNSVPVHLAAQLLDAVQGSITAVGSSVNKTRKIKPPKGPSGKRLGIRKATELQLSSNIGAGSVVFFLEGQADPISGEEILPTGTDRLVDVAVAELFAVLAHAQEDSSEELGELTEDLQRLGAMVASKLNTLAEHTVDNEIELDLGHWAPSGARQSVVLARRGADAIKEAVDRNRERVVPSTFVGILHTVSDGHDQLRLTPDGEKRAIQVGVEPDQGISLGPLLGKHVQLEVSTRVTWKIATGRERRQHTLLSAQEADPENG